MNCLKRLRKIRKIKKDFKERKICKKCFMQSIQELLLKEYIKDLNKN